MLCLQWNAAPWICSPVFCMRWSLLTNQSASQTLAMPISPRQERGSAVCGSARGYHRAASRRVTVGQFWEDDEHVCRMCVTNYILRNGVLHRYTMTIIIKIDISYDCRISLGDSLRILHHWYVNLNNVFCPLYPYITSNECWECDHNTHTNILSATPALS